MSELFLPLNNPNYQFDLLLEFVRRIAYPARMIVRDGALWRVTAGQLLSYRKEGDSIAVRGAGLSAENENNVDRSSRHVLGIDRELAAFYDFAASNKRLWHIIEPVAGMPLFCTETVFEALITLIIEQHITWKNALRAQQTLMRILAAATATEDAQVYDFPTPQSLAKMTRESLKSLKITNRRIDLIIQLAGDALSGRLEIEGFCDLDTQSVYQRLLSVKGVGHWTAANVLGRAMARYPHVSHNDVALQSAVNHYFDHAASKKSAQQVTDTLNNYGEFAGLIGHFVLLRWVLDHYPVAY